MEIILHCSDSDFGNAAIITKWHVLPKPNGRGWSNIGYHYVILNGQLSGKVYNKYFDGNIETGRPLDDDDLVESFEYGEHTKGNNNKIGICLIGISGVFTPQQFKSLNILLSQLKKQFGKIEIKQHSDFDNKKPHCAGLTKEYLKDLNKYHLL